MVANVEKAAIGLWAVRELVGLPAAVFEGEPLLGEAPEGADRHAALGRRGGFVYR